MNKPPVAVAFSFGRGNEHETRVHAGLSRDLSNVPADVRPGEAGARCSARPGQQLPPPPPNEQATRSGGFFIWRWPWTGNPRPRGAEPGSVERPLRTFDPARRARDAACAQGNNSRLLLHAARHRGFRNQDANGQIKRTDFNTIPYSFEMSWLSCLQTQTQAKISINRPRATCNLRFPT